MGGWRWKGMENPYEAESVRCGEPFCRSRTGRESLTDAAFHPPNDGMSSACWSDCAHATGRMREATAPNLTLQPV